MDFRKFPIRLHEGHRHSKSPVQLILSLLLFFLVLSIPFLDVSEAAYVALDPDFGGTGFVRHDNAAGGSGNDFGSGVVIQGDGKIVVAGRSMSATDNLDMTVWRYNTDGTLDTSFDGDGIMTHANAAGGNSADYGYAVALQSDGKIVVAGSSYNLSGETDLVVWRLNSNGTLDTDFDGDGYLTYNTLPADDNDFGFAVGVDSNDKIIVAGSFFNVTDSDIAVWRFDTDGSLDAGFDGDGFATQDIPGADSLYGLAIQNDDKIVAVGASNGASFDDMAVWRFDTDGSLDASFDGDGQVLHNDAAGGNSYDIARSVALQSDGKIVVGGASIGTFSDDATIWRLNSNGSLDTSFDGDGYTSHNSAAGGDGSDNIQGITLQPNGKILAVGYSFTSMGDTDMVAWRYNSDGSLDSGFDNDGFLTYEGIDGGNIDFEGDSVKIQSDGKIVIAGYAFDYSTNADMALWMYLSENQLSGLPVGLDALDVSANNIESGTNYGLYGASETITLKDSIDNLLVSEVVVNMTLDRNWSGVTGDSNATTGKSFVSGLTTAPGAASTHTFYVPIPTGVSSDRVVLCPNATSLAQVTVSCGSAITKQESDSDTDKVTLSGQQ